MLPRRVNFLLDEFSSLPQISDFPSMISASRSRNIRFTLIIQSIAQLYWLYDRHAGTIKGNCENWVFLYSRELLLLNELIDLCGKKSNEEPLVTVSMLQTLDKSKGEVFVLNKRLYPFIANLPDIDIYPGIVPGGSRPPYPQNSRKIQKIFDFEEYCDERPAEYYMAGGDNKKPLFTSTVPPEEEIEAVEYE
jgi:type IV secretion system protein VirD4